jgi:flagellar biosynthesis/type III secretory pathway protein FliH
LFALIPFVILRERRKADRGSPRRRARLAPQVARLVEESLAAALAARDGGRLSDEDVTEIIAAIDRLFTHVYGKYPEFKEVDAVETLMKSRIEIAAEQALERGLEQGLERGLEQGLEQGLERGLERGLEQGLEQGLERGREQGQELERERSIRHALSRGREPREVASLLGVTLDDVARAAA